MEGADKESFSGVEVTGSQTIIPFDWQAGRWYRMVLLCGTSEETGNTTVEQWYMDLTTEKWTHICTIDTGIKESCFIKQTGFFQENYLPAYAGELRSMEMTNIRIHTISDGQWHDVTSIGNFNERTGERYDPGSWQECFRTKQALTGSTSRNIAGARKGSVQAFLAIIFGNTAMLMGQWSR